MLAESVFPQTPFIGKGQVIYKEVAAAAIEAPTHILCRNVMTSQFYAQRHTGHGLGSRVDDDVMKQKPAASCPGFTNEGKVGLAAEDGLDGEAGLRFDKRTRLIQQQTPSLEGAQRGIKRGESPGDFIGIEKPLQPKPWQQLPGEGRPACTVAPAENAQGWRHGLMSEPKNSSGQKEKSLASNPKQRLPDSGAKVVNPS